MRNDGLHLAKLACMFSGLVWGLFWLPLRLLSEAGFEGLWATAAFYVVPMLVLSPLVALRWREVFLIDWHTQISVLLFAAAMLIYATAFLYTEVVRAMFLYYLTPLWGFILARIVLGEAITPIRWLSILFGIVGALIIFELESGFPWPKYIGDWMALAAGVIWAITSLMLLMKKDVNVVGYTTAYFFWGSVFAMLVACGYWIYGVGPPALDVALGAVPWLIPVVVFIVVPGVAAAIYGATKLNPGTVGLLFMTEISIGTAAAVYWADEPFGLREVLGVILITSAGIAEPVRDLIREKRAGAQAA